MSMMAPQFGNMPPLAAPEPPKEDPILARLAALEKQVADLVVLTESYQSRFDEIEVKSGASRKPAAKTGS